MKWIDIHTHLNMLDLSLEEAKGQAQANGVRAVITIGTQSQDHPVVMELVQKEPSWVFGTLGFHPHDAKDFSPSGEAYMQTHLLHPRIVAVGEIGLDYYYDHSDRALQRQVFERQMQLACDLAMPVEIHTRDAEEDTLAILKQFSGRVRGVLHCFTGSEHLAQEALALGYHISVSGVATFKNAESLRETLKKIPLGRLHVETDAPYLAPVPHRGRKNHPAWVVHTAEVLASLKGVTLEELSKQTWQNAMSLFPKVALAQSGAGVYTESD